MTKNKGTTTNMKKTPRFEKSRHNVESRRSLSEAFGEVAVTASEKVNFELYTKNIRKFPVVVIFTSIDGTQRKQECAGLNNLKQLCEALELNSCVYQIEEVK